MTAGADWIGDINKLVNADLGVNFPGAVDSVTFPAIGFDGQNAITGFGANGTADNGGWFEENNRMLGIVLVNNWLLTKGRHTLNIGGQFRRDYQDEYNCGGCGAQFQFTQRRPPLQMKTIRISAYMAVRSQAFFSARRI